MDRVALDPDGVTLWYTLPRLLLAAEGAADVAARLSAVAESARAQGCTLERQGDTRWYVLDAERAVLDVLLLLEPED